ncbi:MAG: hypothetical protein MHM6MM_002221 [Cercozoa sp. M6MM]
MRFLYLPVVIWAVLWYLGRRLTRVPDVSDLSHMQPSEFATVSAFSGEGVSVPAEALLSTELDRVAALAIKWIAAHRIRATCHLADGQGVGALNWPPQTQAAVFAPSKPSVALNDLRAHLLLWRKQNKQYFGMLDGVISTHVEDDDENSIDEALALLIQAAEAKNVPLHVTKTPGGVYLESTQLTSRDWSAFSEEPGRWSLLACRVVLTATQHTQFLQISSVSDMLKQGATVLLSALGVAILEAVLGGNAPATPTDEASGGIANTVPLWKRVFQAVKRHAGLAVTALLVRAGLSRQQASRAVSQLSASTRKLKLQEQAQKATQKKPVEPKPEQSQPKHASFTTSADSKDDGNTDSANEIDATDIVMLDTTQSSNSNITSDVDSATDTAKALSQPSGTKVPLRRRVA